LKIKQAVIFAGGRGKRLKPLTNNLPKPLVNVDGSPFLDYLIFELERNGIEKILILVGYKSKKIISRYQNYKNVKIHFSYSNYSTNTAKRILNAKNMLDEKFLLLYGDNFLKFSLERINKLFINKKAQISNIVFNNKNCLGEYGCKNNIKYNKKRRVVYYDKSMTSKENNALDIGFFIIKKKYISKFKNLNSSFESYILKKVIDEKKMYCFVTSKQYYYITNINSLKMFEKYVKKSSLNKIKI